MLIGDLTKCKVLIFGNSKVGKSSLINKYINGEFNLNYKTTCVHNLMCKD